MNEPLSNCQMPPNCLLIQLNTMSSRFSLYTPTYIQPTMTPAPPRPPYKEKFNFNISCQVPQNFKDVTHKVSIAWKFFQIDQNQEIGRCNFCGALYAVKNWTTSSLLRHLRRSHKQELSQATIKEDYLKNLSRAEHAKIRSKYMRNKYGQEGSEDDEVIEERPEWKNLRPPVKQKKLLVDDFYEKKKTLNEIFANNPILAHYINCFPLYCQPHQMLLTLRKTNQFQLIEIRQGFDKCYWGKSQNTIPQLFVRLDKNQHIHQMIPNLVNNEQQISSITIITRKMNENYLKYGQNKSISFLYSSKIIKNSPMKINVTNATYYSSSQYHPLPKNFYSNGGTEIITYKELEGVIYIVAHLQQTNQPIILGIVLVFDCFYISPFLKEEKKQQKFLIEDDIEGCAAIFKNYFDAVKIVEHPNKKTRTVPQQNYGLPASIFIDAPPIFYRGFCQGIQQLQIQHIRNKKQSQKLQNQHITLDQQSEQERREESQKLPENSQKNNQIEIEQKQQIETDPDPLTKIIFENCTMKYLFVSEILLDSISDKQNLAEKWLFLTENKLRKLFQDYKKKYLKESCPQKIKESVLGMCSMLNITFLSVLMAKCHGISPIYIQEQQAPPILVNFLKSLFKTQESQIQSAKKSTSQVKTNKIKRINCELKKILSLIVTLMTNQIENPDFGSQSSMNIFLLIESLSFMWLQSCSDEFIDIEGERRQSLVQNILKRLVERIPWFYYQKLMYIWTYSSKRLLITAQFLNSSKMQDQNEQEHQKIFKVYQKSYGTDLSLLYQKRDRVDPNKPILNPIEAFIGDLQSYHPQNSNEYFLPYMKSNKQQIHKKQFNQLLYHQSNKQGENLFPFSKNYDSNSQKQQDKKIQEVVKMEGQAQQGQDYNYELQKRKIEEQRRKFKSNLMKRLFPHPNQQTYSKQQLLEPASQKQKQKNQNAKKTKKIKKQALPSKEREAIKEKQKNFFENIGHISQECEKNRQTQIFEVLFLPNKIQFYEDGCNHSTQDCFVCSCGQNYCLGLPCPHVLKCLQYIEENSNYFASIFQNKARFKVLEKIIQDMISPNLLQSSSTVYIKLEEEETESVVVGLIEQSVQQFMASFREQSRNYFDIYKTGELNMGTIGYEGLMKLLFL